MGYFGGVLWGMLFLLPVRRETRSNAVFCRAACQPWATSVDEQ